MWLSTWEHILLILLLPNVIFHVRVYLINPTIPSPTIHVIVGRDLDLEPVLSTTVKVVLSFRWFSWARRHLELEVVIFSLSEVYYFIFHSNSECELSVQGEYQTSISWRHLLRWSNVFPLFQQKNLNALQKSKQPSIRERKVRRISWRSPLDWKRLTVQLYLALSQRI